jgi:hypothetical protein
MRVGTGMPRVIALGSFWFWKGKDFCAVYGNSPGLVIELDPAQSPYHRWLISVDDHQEIMELLKRKMETEN